MGAVALAQFDADGELPRVLGNLLAWTAFQGNAINVGVIMSATNSLANLVWTCGIRNLKLPVAHKFEKKHGKKIQREKRTTVLLYVMAYQEGRIQIFSICWDRQNC